MAEAKQAGGLYYVNGKAVDANGDEVKGAPKQAPDTPADQQPGANGPQSAEDKLATALANALGRGQSASHGKSAEHKPATVNPDELPTLEELPATLQTLTTAKEVQAYRKVDKRVGAKALYQARLEELEAADDDEPDE